MAERSESVLVEGFIHQCAREVLKATVSAARDDYLHRHPRPADHDAYSVWNIMEDKRITRSHRVLWHDSDGPLDYCRLAGLHGLSYAVKDFTDANQGYGQGQA